MELISSKSYQYRGYGVDRLIFYDATNDTRFEIYRVGNVEFKSSDRAEHYINEQVHAAHIAQSEQKMAEAEETIKFHRDRIRRFKVGINRWVEVE